MLSREEPGEEAADRNILATAYEYSSKYELRDLSCLFIMRENSGYLDACKFTFTLSESLKGVFEMTPFNELSFFLL